MVRPSPHPPGSASSADGGGLGRRRPGQRRASHVAGRSSGDDRAAWGGEHDIRVLVADDPATPRPSPPTSPSTPPRRPTARPVGPPDPLRGPARATGSAAAHRPPGAHAWRLGVSELRSLHLRAHAHTFGYTGQFSSKSLRFSTTFGALRGARLAHVRGGTTALSTTTGSGVTPAGATPTPSPTRWPSRSSRLLRRADRGSTEASTRGSTTQ